MAIGDALGMPTQMVAGRDEAEACHGPGSFPPEAIAVIDAHGLGLPGLAAGLLALRERPGNEAR